MMTRTEKLQSFLTGLNAECEGAIPFERFMREALYHPEFGYYTAGIDTVGRGGDFSTAATLSGQLGRGISRWVRVRAAEFQMEKKVIEIGAGDGSLAEAVLKNWSWWRRRAAAYHIVEASPRLTAVQRKRLKRFRNVRWHDSIEPALAACGGEALIFSNELVDAFPVRLLRWNGKMWEEGFVSFDSNRGIEEKFRPAVTDGLSSTSLNEVWPAGQRIEIHDSYRRWLRSWAANLKKGALLTIDYGGGPREIYHRKPRGSLRGFFRHQRMEGAAIYGKFGRQDLTADVNFDDLEKWGREADLATVSRESQAGWLARWTSRELDFPAEAMEAFRILEQERA